MIHAIRQPASYVPTQGQSRQSATPPFQIAIVNDGLDLKHRKPSDAPRNIYFGDDEDPKAKEKTQTPVTVEPEKETELEEKPTKKETNETRNEPEEKRFSKPRSESSSSNTTTRPSQRRRPECGFPR